jgi:cytoskeletal protein RodZ
MKNVLLILLFLAGLAMLYFSCGKSTTAPQVTTSEVVEQNATKDNNNTATETEEATATTKATDETATKPAVEPAEEAKEAEASDAESAPVPEANAAATAEKDWRAIYNEKVPYYTKATDVNMRENAGLNEAVKVVLSPNDGGMIQDCNEDASWCQINAGAKKTGWVKMSYFTAKAS